MTAHSNTRRDTVTRYRPRLTVTTEHAERVFTGHSSEYKSDLNRYGIAGGLAAEAAQWLNTLEGALGYPITASARYEVETVTVRTIKITDTIRNLDRIYTIGAADLSARRQWQDDPRNEK